jgi:hypothetical protein
MSNVFVDKMFWRANLGEETKESDVKIEKNIPIPGIRGGALTRKYPFNEMEVGDSIFVEKRKGLYNPGNAAGNYGKTHGMKFSVRKVEGGFRIWRIK